MQTECIDTDNTGIQRTSLLNSDPAATNCLTAHGLKALSNVLCQDLQLRSLFSQGANYKSQSDTFVFQYWQGKLSESFVCLSLSETKMLQCLSLRTLFSFIEHILNPLQLGFNKDSISTSVKTPPATQYQLEELQNNICTGNCIELILGCFQVNLPASCCHLVTRFNGPL